MFGSISDGVFHGKIITPRKGAWYVERAHYYFSPHEINETLHSVIYHEDDVGDPYTDVRQGEEIPKKCFFNVININLRETYETYMHNP